MVMMVVVEMMLVRIAKLIVLAVIELIKIMVNWETSINSLINYIG